MSRIHDALKKAEQERGATQTIETAIAQPEPSINPSSAFSEASSTVATDEKPSSHSIPPSLLASEGFLRYEDLMERCAHPRWQLDPNANVFSGANSGAAEQFRTLRSRLYQLRTDHQIKTLLIASAVPAEGKTFVASNLAQAIVRQPDRRVLLIDGDLRCPRLHMPFGAPSAPGLTDYLRGEADEVAVIQGGHENLCFIPGGNEVTNPSELLANGRFATLLDRVTPVFDWIILDSAPCLPVADSTMLAEHCDAVLLVVRAGVTPSEIAQRALQELQNHNIAGVVLNAVEENHIYGSYYYGGYGYGPGSKKRSSAVASR